MKPLDSIATRLLPVVALLIGTLPTLLPSPAQAAAYALSQNAIFDFKIENATVPPPAPPAPTNKNKNVATLQGHGSTTKDMPPADPPQAGVGGPLPPENQFSAVGEKGHYARADTRSTATTDENIAETYVNSTDNAFGSAIATVTDSGTIVQAGNDPIIVSFMAVPYMRVKADPGDIAISSLEFTFYLYSDSNVATRTELLRWSPGGCQPFGGPFIPGCFEIFNDAGSVSNVVDSFSLNASLVTSGGEKTYGSTVGLPLIYSLSFDHGAGQSMYFELEFSEFAYALIPEPGSIGLLAVALTALSYRIARRRRTAARSL